VSSSLSNSSSPPGPLVDRRAPRRPESGATLPAKAISHKHKKRRLSRADTASGRRSACRYLDGAPQRRVGRNPPAHLRENRGALSLPPRRPAAYTSPTLQNSHRETPAHGGSEALGAGAAGFHRQGGAA